MGRSLNRKRLTRELLSATAGGKASEANHLQTLYYSTRLLGMARRRHSTPPPQGGGAPSGAPEALPNPSKEPAVDNDTTPRGIDVPEPGDDHDEPIAGSEGGDIPPAALEPGPDPDEEPA